MICYLFRGERLSNYSQIQTIELIIVIAALKGRRCGQERGCYETRKSAKFGAFRDYREKAAFLTDSLGQGNSQRRKSIQVAVSRHFITPRLGPLLHEVS